MENIFKDDTDLNKFRDFNESKNINAETIYAIPDGTYLTYSPKINVVNPSDYVYAKIPIKNIKLGIVPKFKRNARGEVIGQTGFEDYSISEWLSILQKSGVKNISLANLTLYEPSGKATGVFVSDGRIRVPGTNYQYYTMSSETRLNSRFDNYVTVAIGKNGSFVKLYETDKDSTAEEKILKDLYKIQYAFSGTRWLIKDGGELNNNIGILEKDKNRAKTSIGFTATHMLVVVTRYSGNLPTSKDNFPQGHEQTWSLWANTLRQIEPTATWVSMDGGGSPGIVINGVLKKGTSREIPNIIYWV